jgi:hypothetical protein
MKIHQIISESAVNEAPGGSALGNIARKVGAKAAGAVGMKNTSAGLSGKAQSNDRAKEIGVKWTQFANQTGAGTKAPDASALADFLAKEKLSTARLKGMSGKLTPKQVDDILTKVAQDTFKGAAGQAAVGNEPEADPSLGGKFGGPEGNDAGGAGTGQGAGATAQSGSDSGATAQGGATAQSGSGQAGANGIPKNIQAQLDKLTPQQKKELAALL